MTSDPSGRSAVRAYGPAVLWAIAIFCASSIPSSAMPSSIVFSQDKLLHMGVYAVLGFFVYHGNRQWGMNGWRSAAWLSFGLCVLYGASDEVHQHFVPGRSMDIFDLLADAFGVVCAIVFARLLELRSARRA